MGSGSGRHFAIISLSERGWWNHDQGWVSDLRSATTFADFRMLDKYDLPNSKEDDAVWVEATALLDGGDDVVFSEERDEPLRILGDGHAIIAARKQYEDEGTLEIDHVEGKDITEMVSRGDDPGAYVKAWVWVAWPTYGIEAWKLPLDEPLANQTDMFDD